VTGIALFDVDGTIIRAGDPDHRAAFDAALARVYGVPATLDGIPLGGMIDRAIARLALAPHDLGDEVVEAGLADLVEAMGAAYRAAVTEGARRSWLLPGVEDAARRLRAEGVTTGVLTGGCRPVVEAKLAAAGVADLFGAGAYGDQADERAALVPLAVAALGGGAGTPVVVVGDTPLDVEAAHTAGVPCLAVATGRWSVDELAACGADAVVPDLADPRAVPAVLGLLRTRPAGSPARPPR
jgi:phosphoglycolate phosphatase-like HAD superfamily hydrolase